MAAIDRDILLEALSALTGAHVKHHHEMKPHHQPHQILQLDHFLHTIISKKVRVIEAIKAINPIDVTVVTPETSLIKDEFGQQFYAPDKTSQVKDEFGPKVCVTPETSLVKTEFFVDMEKFFDRNFDYDFRDMKEPSTCSRGGEEYRRPIGWYRFALNVLGIYGDNAWLGTAGWRSESVPGEWPVSFHGTSIYSAKHITGGHYKAGPREVHGRGIYSTPSIEVAEKYYSEKFTSEKTGKEYKVIMQNRINPKKREIYTKKVTGVGDYWVIPVPKDTPLEEEKKIVHRNIRPYGILIKEVI